MNNWGKTALIAVAVLGGTALYAGPAHHHHGNDGIRLAADILSLVDTGLNIISPARTTIVSCGYPTVWSSAAVVTAPVVVERPVVIREVRPTPPPPPRHRSEPPRSSRASSHRSTPAKPAKPHHR